MSTAGPLALPPPVASEPGAVERIVRSPGRFCAAILAITTLGLALDHYADLGFQVLLAICAWGFLATAFVYLTPDGAGPDERRGRRGHDGRGDRLGPLGRLRLPPGQPAPVRAARARARLPDRAAHEPDALGRRRGRGSSWGWRSPPSRRGPCSDCSCSSAGTWRGAIGAAILVLFLLRGRAPAVYAGVFFAVAYLEIYGTAVGTWRWATEIPGVGVADGNPPSGAACGYVFFDIAALYLAPALLAGWSRLRRLSPR